MISKTISKYLQSGVVQNLFIYGFGALFLKGISFCLLPLYTSLISPADFGKLELLSSFSLMLDMVLALGLAQFLFIAYFKTDQESRNILLKKILFIYSTLVLLLYGLVFLMESLDKERFFHDIPYRLILLIMLTTFLAFFQNLYVVYLKLEMKVRQATTNQVIFGVLAILLNVYLVYHLRIGYTGIVIAAFIAMLAGSTYSLFRLIKNCQNAKIRYSLKESLGILKSSNPFIPNMIAVWFMNSINRWILLDKFGVSKVGLYSVAAKFNLLLEPHVIQPFLNVYAPRVLQRYGSVNFKQPLGRYVIILIPAFILIAITLSLLANFMIDESYDSALKLIPIMVAGYFFSLLAQMMGTFLLYRKKTTTLLLAVTIGAVFSIVGNLVLIGWFGLQGSVIGTSLGNATWFIITVVLVIRERKAMKLNLTIS